LKWLEEVYWELFLKNRLFISLNIPDNMIEQIISLRDKIFNNENIKWEPKEKLHLTIKFIGDVSDEITDKIRTNYFLSISIHLLNVHLVSLIFFIVMVSQ